MSGLCGVVTFDGAPVDGATIGPMVAAAGHRGASGVHPWVGEGAAFAQLSHGTGHATEPPAVRGSLVCVADARLDNADELLSSLGRDGVAVDGSGGVGALILTAYQRWGAACAPRLLGDFAFVVWDGEARRLFAARDAMGSRSLCWWLQSGRRLLVGTEPKQLLVAPGMPTELDEAAVVADLAGLYRPHDRTPFRQVDQLAPAYALEVDRTGSRSWRYWDIDPGHRIHHRREEEYAEHLRDLLTTAVADRLQTPRPVGIALSGGLDSVAVAGAAGWLQERGRVRAPAVRAYSWAFADLEQDDERSVSDPLAAHYGMPVTAVSGDDAWPLHHDVVPDRDDPFMWLYQDLAERTLQAARADGVGVLLMADRGDEMIGNWPFDELGLALSGRWRLLADSFRTMRASQGVSPLGFAEQRLVKPLMTTLWPPGRGERVRSRLLRGAGSSPSIPPWIHSDVARRLQLADIIQEAGRTLPIRGHARLQRYTSAFHIVSTRIAQLREATAARYGVSHADPWGDRRIAEFACAVPQWRVQHRSEPKDLARHALRGLVPEPVRTAARGHGPYGLFSRAFDEREASTVRALFTDSRAAARGWLDPAAVVASYETYRAGGDLQHDFWFPICVELWLRRWWDH